MRDGCSIHWTHAAVAIASLDRSCNARVAKHMSLPAIAWIVYNLVRRGEREGPTKQHADMITW